MLTVVKSLNNNIILALTDKDEELVVFGTGIGFKKRKGDKVDSNRATKVFQTGLNTQASQLLADIPIELINVTEKIVAYGEKILQRKLNATLCFTLADHLRCAIQRQHNRLDIDAPFQWEIPHLYAGEYEVGKAALLMINEAVNSSLPKAEAAFIALHFVNAQVDKQTMGETIKITQLIKQIFDIIQSSFGITLNKTVIAYSRFITHLRFFIARQKLNKGNTDLADIDSDLNTIIQDRYIKSYACGLVIKTMLEKEYQWEMSENELVYIVIHIEQLVKAS